MDQVTGAGIGGAKKERTDTFQYLWQDAMRQSRLTTYRVSRSIGMEPGRLYRLISGESRMTVDAGEVLFSLLRDRVSEGLLTELAFSAVKRILAQDGLESVASVYKPHALKAFLKDPQ